MAKKDADKKKKGASAKQGSSRGDAVRSAAAQAIEATAGQAGFTRERAQQLADELLQAAGRFRETLEELRPAGSDELRTLRDRVAALEERVATLEKRRAPRRRTTAAKPRAPKSPPAPPADAQPRAPAEPPASAEPSGSAEPPGS